MPSSRHYILTIWLLDEDPVYRCIWAGSSELHRVDSEDYGPEEDPWVPSHLILVLSRSEGFLVGHLESCFCSDFVYFISVF